MCGIGNTVEWGFQLDTKYLLVTLCMWPNSFTTCERHETHTHTHTQFIVCVGVFVCDMYTVIQKCKEIGLKY